MISIGTNAFESCDNLKNITIPDSVKTIEFAAFRYCKNLEKIEIPKGVSSIGLYVFSGCTALSQITIQESVTYLEDTAFKEYNKKTIVNYEGT